MQKTHIWKNAAEAARKGFKSIGSHVEFSDCDFGHKERITIGNHIYIGPRCFLQGMGGIHLNDYCILGPEVAILSSMHNHDSATAKMVPYDEMELLCPANIGMVCWIGLRTVILPGVRLGDGCVVGAGSVVTKSWPDGSILGGGSSTLDRTKKYEAFPRLLKKREHLHVG